MEEECPLPGRKLSVTATKGLFSPTLDMHPTQIPSVPFDLFWKNSALYKETGGLIARSLFVTVHAVIMQLRVTNSVTHSKQGEDH